MSTNFQPIFDYIDESQRQLKDFFTLELNNFATKQDIKSIKDAIDSFAKSSHENKRGVNLLEHKSERIEHWVIKASQKIKVPYKP